ncbi:hypothetical protein DFH06DRAFT_939276, partial [Mycena polygramma]
STMLQWKEFSAWISIDGREPEEYGVEVDEDEKTVTCWIASELGKKFSVHWSNTSYCHDTRGKVSMDGVPCSSYIIFGGNVPKTRVADGVSEDGISVKPFMFSSLELTDDDTILGGPSYAELGVIKLAISPVQITDPGVPRPKAPRFLSDPKVHERAKKAITQHIKF